MIVPAELSVALAFLAPLAGAGGHPRPYVRTSGVEVRELGGSAQHATPPPLASSPGSMCTEDALAWHNQPAPGGGTLAPLAFANPSVFAGRSEEHTSEL